ncbi:RdgB/HAM1 family non-canonical purine NTP pyrophosphatase [Actinomycetaceae bacterium WB03_NA08]|uniref:dITP/XTP pyrophosphatase n=1 Tax=Scrofimicrobium canadense TaxID=2652290 RepID=A0A6N7VU17_9ACTO|nr:RdgB/HAM1 family non-canonical purine NTP pyrophosphatase [Scrofimicrobium canadense]MSS85264.1 RdgB/HAM1 family non-canonical purine NTP pyrophosphatase [Scrofimicrobium canadense]
MKIVVATGNAHKLSEVRAILSPVADSIVPLSDFDAPEPVEDGITFAENALIKARSACEITGLAALADDSGITVDVLGGAPGVFSARWSGHHGDDAANRNLLLAQLSDVPDRHRQAAFVSAIALVLPDGGETVVEGRVEGMLTREARGSGGFGYDPIFIPTGHEQTTAEMTAEEKNALSHRGIALRKLLPIVTELTLGD